MQVSAEVRWFIEGNVPLRISEWFKVTGVAAKSEGARVDIYFNLAGNDNLSIKLRGGRIEFKRQQADLGSQNLRDDVEGRIEEWMKWSFTLDETRDKPDVSTSAGDWIPVSKSRLVKKYEVTARDAVKAVDAAQEIDQGCNVELTEIIVSNQTWWSLGFEAFGKVDRVEKNLRLVLAQVLADGKFPSMRAENSYSYPKWLGLTLGQVVVKD